MAAMAVQPMVPAPGNIPLSTLIDHILQKTYHELSVLAELLPRKTDMERKMEIVQFADRSRQLFIRLLAVVKWAKSGHKIDKCMIISNLLDKQTMMFVDTADQLAKIARDTLLQARLPCFSIPTAVDVLTTGTYPRLPTAIKDKIIPLEPISSEQKQITMKRLRQAIEYRLTISDIPKTFTGIVLGEGKVTLVVSHEFSVTLTLMGDGPTIPWRLLSVDILVENAETSESSPLVHPLQLQYVHSLVQSRITDSEGQSIENPLTEICTILHSFCQSLQLEILFNQAQRQIHERLDDTIHIEEYEPSKKLTVSYWRDRQPAQKPTQITPGHLKLTVSVHPTDPWRPLRIEHSPPLEISGTLSSIQSSRVSLAKLLLDSGHSRSKTALKELKRGLQKEGCGTDFKISNVPPMLTFAILHPSMESEQVQVCMDNKLGRFLVSMPQYRDCPITKDIQAALGSMNTRTSYSAVAGLLKDCRLWLALQRCKKSMQYTNSAQYCEHLPLVDLASHPLSSVSRYRLYIKLPNHESLYMVVCISLENESVRLCSVKHEYYLLTTSQCPFDPADQGDPNVPHLLVKPEELSKLNSGALRGNILSSIGKDMIDDLSVLVEKMQARVDVSCYFVGSLLHVVNVCKEKAAFALLNDELWNKGVPHQGVQMDCTGACHSLCILGLPAEVGGGLQSALFRSLEACTFRVNTRMNEWVVEYLFAANSLLESIYPEQGGRLQVISSFDVKGSREAQHTVDLFLQEWASMIKLYDLVADYMHWRKEYNQDVQIASYDVKKIVFHYGPSYEYSVTLHYDPVQRFFPIKLGINKSTSGTNPHLMILDLLQTNFTTIQQFLKVLTATVRPLVAIKKIPSHVLYGLSNKTGLVPECNIMLLIQTATNFRLSYRKMHSLDIRLLDNGLVALRDSSCNVFEPSKAIDIMTPLHRLKEFLSLYVDNTALLRPQQSMCEDVMSASPRTGDPTSIHSPRTGPSSSPAPGYSPLDMLTRSPMAGVQSPSTLVGNSPGQIPTASPGFAHLSPATSFVGPGQLGEGSPFTGPSSNQPMGVPPSPAGRAGWVGSPALGAGPSPRNAQVLSPQHQQTGLSGSKKVSDSSSYTVLSCDALFSLVTRPGKPAADDSRPPSHVYSPLESFLGCSYLLRFFPRCLQEKEVGPPVETRPPPSEGSISFKTVCFVCTVTMHVETHPTLTLSLALNPDIGDRIKEEDLRMLEKYFLHKIVCPPYRLNHLISFKRLLSAPLDIVKECITLIQMELSPDRGARWSLQWCWTLPQSARLGLEPGNPVVLIKLASHKFFFVLKFSSMTGTDGRPMVNSQPVCIPFLLDMQKGVLSVARQSNPPPTLGTVQVEDFLKTIQERNAHYPTSISTCIKELLHSGS